MSSYLPVDLDIKLDKFLYIIHPPLSQKIIDTEKLIGENVICVYKTENLERNLNINNIIKINDKQIKIGFMIMINPDKTKRYREFIEYLVLNGTSDEIRPYITIMKECHKK